MEFSVSTPRYHYHYPKPTTTFSLKPPNSQPSSNQLRRPKTITTSPSPPPRPTKPIPKIPSNPFKNLTNPTHVPTPPITTSLTNKLWLTSKLSPPPPPPDIDDSDEEEEVEEVKYNEPKKKPGRPRVEFRQEGKIFVGTLPNWVKKNELSKHLRA